MSQDVLGMKICVFLLTEIETIVEKSQATVSRIIKRYYEYGSVKTSKEIWKATKTLNWSYEHS